MKRKDKSKAQAFLKKYQIGGFYADDTLMQNPYEYAPDLQTAQQQQLVQYNQPKNQNAFIKPQAQGIQGFGLDNAIPLIGPAINLGIGIKNIIDSFGERKRQKQYERAYKRDLERRMDEARTNDYYHTPYGVPGTNYGSYQNGGLYQPNQMDFFIDFYNQKENQNDISQQAFENYYQNKNQMYKDRWKQKQSSGIQGALSGALGIAQTFLGKFQKGGLKPDSLMQRNSTNTQLTNLTADYFNLYQPDTITTDVIDTERASYIWNYKRDNPEIFDMIMGLSPDRPKPSKSRRFYKNEREKQDGGEYNSKVDIYSPEYDPNEFLGIENEIQAAQIEDKEASVIESWLFQDEPELDELNLDYFNPEQTPTDKSNLDIISNIEALESGGNPEVVNPTTNATGLFQFVPKYWAGQIKSYMGLPQTFTQEQVMEAFKKNEKVQRDFMNHVVNDIYMPEVEKLRPLARKYGLNDNKIIKLLHYRGVSDAKRRLQTGDFTVSAEEKAKYGNPNIMEYLNK